MVSCKEKKKWDRKGQQLSRQTKKCSPCLPLCAVSKYHQTPKTELNLFVQYYKQTKSDIFHRNPVILALISLIKNN